MEEWTTIHHGVYPAYITWEQFLANQARLADNASDFARRAHGAPRQGYALLAGLVVCGRCGYQMRVTYKPQRRYTCTALAASYGAATCLHVDGASLEAVVVEAFFQALAPAELNLLEEVLKAQQADVDRVAQLRADQVARAEYEAGLAQRHYQAVDPANRLVAAELERRWEVALQAVVEARQERDRMASQPQIPELTGEMKEHIQDLGKYLPAMWASERLTPAHQKELLRSLIRRIIVKRPTPDTVEARVVWVSGAVTPFSVHPPIARGSDVNGYEQLVERILTLGAQGYQDPEIARIVSAEGFRSARRARIPASLVGEIRRARGQISLTEQFKTQAKVEGQWTIFGLAQELSVHRNWLYTRIHKGTLPATRHSVTGHYLIADEPEILATLRAER
jgi:Recombinase zinc beta ribbon domain